MGFHHLGVPVGAKVVPNRAQLSRLRSRGIRMLPLYDWQHVLIGRLSAVGPLRCLEKSTEPGAAAWALTLRLSDHSGELDVVLWNTMATRYATALRRCALGTCIAVAGARLSEWNGVPRANLNAPRYPRAHESSWLAPGKDLSAIVQVDLPYVLDATGFLSP